MIQLGVDKNDLLFAELTSAVLESSFEILDELGNGFLETVYKNALYVYLKENGFSVDIEQPFNVNFRNHVVGLYKVDLIVEKKVIIELKACKCLLPEHQAQVINYLKVTDLPVGLLLNFGNMKLEYKRLHHPKIHSVI